MQNSNEREYVRSLGFKRALLYVGKRWGANVVMSLDVVWQPNGKPVLLGSAAVLDPLVASELDFPPPVVLTTRLQDSTSLDAFLKDLLLLWDKTVAEHTASRNDPTAL